jgi:hypothetical protein
VWSDVGLTPESSGKAGGWSFRHVRTQRRAVSSATPYSDDVAARHDRPGEPAKSAVGDGPVFAYLRSLPQRAIAERVDALAAETLPALRRAVKWGLAFYGVGDGWCFSCGGFAGHVKLTFLRGTALEPAPPTSPIGMGKDARGVDLASVTDLNEGQAAAQDSSCTRSVSYRCTIVEAAVVRALLQW